LGRYQAPIHPAPTNIADQLNQTVKEILASQDPLLIKALALHTTALQMVVDTNNKYKKDIENLKDICEELKRKIESPE
jgi:hypothetical protein